MVHPRVRTSSENRDNVDQQKGQTKHLDYNDKVNGFPCHLFNNNNIPSCGEECRVLIGRTGGEVKADMSPHLQERTKSVCQDDKEDPWEAPQLDDDTLNWSELCIKDKVQRVCVDWLLKPVCLLMLLYMFVCSLDFLSSAFRLLGGKTAGQAFSSNTLLKNPVCGLMIGILATVLVQSSSTSTSIIITMVASEFLLVRDAIFIIMGANIGTSVTNTIVSMAQSGDRDQFRRAFAGATLHDMFNWLSVLVLLPLEVVTGYLYHLTAWMTKSVGSENSCQHSNCKSDFLKKITKPFTEKVIQLDKNVIEGIAVGKEEFLNKSMIKNYCSYEEVTVQEVVNTAASPNTTINSSESQTLNLTQLVGKKQCSFLLQNTGLSDTWVGLLLMAVSLLMLCLCLILIVKLLNSVLKGKIATLVKKVVNAEFPGKCSYFTGYVAMLLGAGMTVLVQSSSVFTSAMTPLVGLGVIRLERMYPLTLGSNIGTTATGMLAALAASGGKLQYSVQIALVHLFFNLSGILLFYPLPQLRFPIAMAKCMGNQTAKYRWFAVFYLVVMFFLLPALVFALTLAGTVVLVTALAICLLLAIPVLVLNVLQAKVKDRLPERFQTWDFLPYKWMHSLDPLDKLLTKLLSVAKHLCCVVCYKCQPEKTREQGFCVVRVVTTGSSLFTDATRQTTI